MPWGRVGEKTSPINIDGYKKPAGSLRCSDEGSNHSTRQIK